LVLLKLNSVSKNFGGLKAVQNVNLDILETGVEGLIGPNGSGKTTLLNLISGIYRLSSGTIFLNGKQISGLPPHKISLLGIARTFQVPRVFERLSVLKNLLIPYMAIYPNESRQNAIKKAIEVLEFLTLTRVKDNLAGEISGGQKILLEFGRTIMREPKIYLLDEPFAGVNLAIKEVLIKSILELSKSSSFIIVSHETGKIAEVCDRVTVLADGKIIAKGPCCEVLKDEKVLEAYLGG
jgi:branched-chain amino acid transport system ATP-binding protein